jgi:hypothetical protein
MRNFKLLILLISVVFLAGCIRQPTAITGANGVIIRSFSPDFAEVRSGERVTFTLTVENVGEADAKEVAAEIFGGIHPDAGWVFVNPTTSFQEKGELKRADPTINLPGEIYDFVWELESPSDLRVDTVYTADARVYFKYSTSTVGTLRFYTYDYLRSLTAEQAEELKKQAGVISVESSSAPVQVSLSVGARPLIVYGDADSFSLQLIISNVGSGSIFNEAYRVTATSPITGEITLPLEELFKVDVEIDSGLTLSCPGINDGNSFTGKGNGTISLIRGKSKTLFCTIQNVNKDVIGNKKDYTITIDLGYGYYVDSSTSITVLKAQ